MKILKILSPFTVFAFILAGCSTPPNSTSVAEEIEVTQSDISKTQSGNEEDIEAAIPVESPKDIATAWVADTLIKDGEVIEIKSPHNPYITIQNDGSFTGRTPCNTYEGRLEINKEGIITVEPIVTTLGLCENETLNEIEADYLYTLDQIQKGMVGQLSDTRLGLILFNDDGDEMIRFFQGE